MLQMSGLLFDGFALPNQPQGEEREERHGRADGPEPWVTAIADHEATISQLQSYIAS